MSELKEKITSIPMDTLVCPDCRGDGFLDSGLRCGSCSGRGVTLKVGTAAEYYWGRDLLGHSSRVRFVYDFIDRLAHSLAWVLAGISLAIGNLFIIANNRDFFARTAAAVDKAEEALGAQPDFASVLLVSADSVLGEVIRSLMVIVERRGFEPLLFWAGLLVACYFYYRSRTADISKKEIDIAAKRFRPFYDPQAVALSRAVDISDYASARTLDVLTHSLDLAHDRGQAPGALHVARSLLKEDGIVKLMKRLEVDRENFAGYLEGILLDQPRNEYYARKGFWRETVLSPELKRMTIDALTESLGGGFEKIEPESLFLALLRYELIGKYFHDLKLEPQDLKSAVLWSTRWSGYRSVRKRPRKIEHNIMNRAWTARVTPELDQFSYDLTDYARSGLTGVVVDRVRELDCLMRILERTSQNNALIIGEQGSGRTTVVKALANRMIHDEVLSTLKDKRLVVLDIGSLVAGARGAGELEQRIQSVVGDMGKSGNIILYIPDIHNMAAAGSAQGYDASKALSPILAQGLFQIIGSTDYRNYRRYIEPRADFANNFDLVKVEELAEEDALKALAIQAGMIEAREGIVMTYNAIKAAVELSKRYIPDRLLPGKAIDLLSETAVEVRRRGYGSVLRDEDVMRIITEKTGIPVGSINTSEAEKLLNLEEELHKRVIGQETAIKSVASAIRRVRVGMKMSNRPIGAFLFLGPTGVGKTELAKALAEVYYGDENAMIRLDMSEYQTVNSVEKLIGYSSQDSGDESDSGGVLTEAVKHKPFSLILLDELEKANRNVLNLFLQVLDDGRLTDNLGRTVDFTNTIIIATSNAGSSVVSKMYVDGECSNQRVFEMIEPYLLQSFAPEFLNRFTDKIIFRSLGPKDLTAIAHLQIKQLAERLDQAQGIRVEVEEDALGYLVETGYSPEYGARFLQRTLQEKLENFIAVKFLKGEIKRGDTFRIAAADLRSL